MIHGLGEGNTHGQPDGQPTGMPQQPPEQGMGGDPMSSEVSPEEQQIYNRAVSLFMLALYDEQMQTKTLDFIRNADTPAEGVAEVTSLIAMRVYAKAQEGGVEIPGDVMLHAGKDEFVPLVVELAEAAGIAEFDQNMIDAAFYLAADKFSNAMRAQGSYSDEMRQGELQELDGMADNGQIEALMQRIEGEQGGGQGAPMGPGPATGPAPTGGGY